MDIAEALNLKLRQEIRVNPFRQGFGHVDSQNFIDLNAVKLCSQVQKRSFAVVRSEVTSEMI